MLPGSIAGRHQGAAKSFATYTEGAHTMTNAYLITGNTYPHRRTMRAG